MFEVNLRSVMSFREIGKGHDALVNHSRCMNLQCLSQPAYRKLNQKLHTAYETAATKSMQAVAEKIRDTSTKTATNNSSVCRVTIDGSWQKRGHSSLNGVVAATNNGKCLDVHICQSTAEVVKYGSIKRHSRI